MHLSTNISDISLVLVETKSVFASLKILQFSCLKWFKKVRKQNKDIDSNSKEQCVSVNAHLI